jgi:hypothetical protein
MSPKRLEPVKKSAQTVRAKKRRSKRITTSQSKTDMPSMKTLNVTTKPTRPLASFAGMWADDETFAEFTAAIAANRQAMDADVSQP